MNVQQLPIVELQYADETGSKGAISLHVPLGTTYAEAAASATALAALIAPVTGCTLVRQRIIFKSVVDPRNTAAMGSSIKRAGVFIFEDTFKNRQALVSIPGILDAVLTVDGPGAGIEIDRANADVINFISIYTAGLFTNPFGDVMESLLAAYRQSRT